MRPDPIVPSPVPRRIPSSGARPATAGRVRGPALAVVATATLLVLAIAPASASTVDRSWRANVGTAGANGAVTVVAYTSGSGAAMLRLTSLPASTLTAITLRAGTCAKRGTVAGTLAPSRSSAAGSVSGTRSLTKAAVARLRAAPWAIATVRAGSFARCAVLRLAVPAPSPSPSPSPASAAIDVKAAGFAFTPTSIGVAASVPFSVTFSNRDAGVPHGFDIGTSETSAPLFAATVITGTASETFIDHGLAAGTYVFYHPIHHGMKGTLTVGSVGSTAPSPVAAASAQATQTPSPTQASPATPDPMPYPTYPTYPTYPGY